MAKIKNEISNKNNDYSSSENYRVLPNLYKRVRMIVVNGQYYRLRRFFNHTPINIYSPTFTIFIPYSVHPDLLVINTNTDGITLDFSEIINEVITDITTQLASVSIMVNFNRVAFHSTNSTLQIVPARIGASEPRGAIMYTLAREANILSELSIIRVSNYLSTYLENTYQLRSENFLDQSRRGVFREALRQTFYHEMGHVLGLAHPDVDQGGVTIITANDNINYGCPIMLSSTTAYYENNTSAQRLTIRFAPQELEALRIANSDNPNVPLTPPPRCILTRDASACLSLYIADSRPPSEILSGYTAFSSLAYSDGSDKVELMNENFFGHSIKSGHAKYIMASGNLNALVTALSSEDFTDKKPIYIYEVYPQFVYSIRKYYESFNDRQAILGKFAAMLSYDPYFIKGNILRTDISKAILYVDEDGKYRKLDSIDNSYFVAKSQQILNPDAQASDAWIYRTIYKVNGSIPLGLSPSAHLGGKGAGPACLNPQPVDIGEYGPYGGSCDFFGFIGGYVRCIFNHKGTHVGKFYVSIYPILLGGSGPISEDVYFNYPLSDLVKSNRSGLSVGVASGALGGGGIRISINTPGIMNGYIDGVIAGFGTVLAGGTDGHFYDS
ncbi:hypothetical protein ABSA28_00211 [Candidatus Hepatincolaceae symbiont of Richtersius coronifer]